MMARGLFLWGSLGLMIALPAAAEEPLFPFVVSYDTSRSVADLSGWLARPAGGNGFVRVEDGRTANDAGPIRFWATNLCFEACFPDREQAQRVAARLAGLGINCVRMHHMDARSIWGDSPNHLTIDAKKLQRLDYLVHQLKLRGIHTNINLHVSRWLGPKEGFASRDGRPKYDKGLGNFEPRMIELQKKYARDLLTHVNPYTKTAYVDEPAVAFVEISNEDALFTVWGRGQLDALPDPYAATFRKLWNGWLRTKYGTTEKLRKTWNVGAKPLGEEMLKNGGFGSPPGKHWKMQRDTESQVEWSTRPDDGPDGKPCLRVVVTRQGSVSWVPQFSQGGLAVKKDTPYTLSFAVRADRPRRISVNCMMAHEPWQRLGLSTAVMPAKEWKRHRCTFVAEKDDAEARITFSNLAPGTYELADVSLRPGGIVGLQPGENLDDDTVPVLRRGELNLTKAARADFVDFLWDTERDYWSGMYRFLKEELGVKSLVSGTQLSYSPVHVQADLDYIDAHSYWQHPHFPGRPWDPRNWTVRNVAMVNSPGATLGGLAVRRVAGMAYTVSEYNHPQPNVHAAEGFPMIAALGAFQSWDGIFSFTYSHSTDFEPRRITSFFDIRSDTARLVHMPACAAMFFRGDVEPAKTTLRVPLSKRSERETLHETLNIRSLTAEHFGLDPRLSLLHAVAMELTGERAGSRKELPELPEDVKVFTSDTGEIRWDVSRKGAGYFTVDTPRTKLFTGFVAGRTFRLGDVTLTIGPTRLDWATISMVAVDAPGFDKPGRILVAATGWTQNTGAELQDMGGERVTLGNRWGEEPILCEGVPAEITLPVDASRVRLFPLDETGRRRAALPVAARDGRAQITLTPRHKTVWYEVEIR